MSEKLTPELCRTFYTILTTLHDLGYGLEWMVLNSARFGVPQSRRRVFLIRYLDPRCAGNSVTVNVIEAIGRRLRAVDEELRRDAA